MGLNKDVARKFLVSLDSTREVFTFQAISDKKEDHRASRVKVGTLNEVWDWILAKQREGYGIFVTAQIMDGHGRKLENVRGVRCVYQEDDNNWQGDFPLPPSLVVQTSPGKHHRYWFLEGPTTDYNTYKQIMQVMVEDYGSDKNAKDLCRVMRLPGTLHLKGWSGGVGRSLEGAHEVEIVEASEARYSLDQLAKALQVSPELRPERGQREAAEWALKRPIESLRGRDDVVARLLRRWGMDDRDAWLRAGMILHHQYEGGADGLELWDRISAEFDNYTEDGCAVAWESFNEGGRGSEDVLTARSLIEAGKVDADQVLEEIETGAERGDIDVRGVTWDISMLDAIDRDVCRKALTKATGSGAKVISGLLRDLEKVKRSDGRLDHRGMALMVIAEHGDDLLNVGGVLYRYDGVVWSPLDSVGLVLLVRDIVNSVPKIRVDDGLYRKVGNMVADLLCNPVDGEDWKWNRIEQDAVAVLNGVVVPPGVLRAHRKEDYLNTCIPLRWSGEGGDVEGIEDKFLSEIMSGDEDRVELLWRMIGYCMMSNTRREKFFILVGDGANGKSVLTNLIGELLKGKTCNVKPDSMHDPKRIEALQGKYVNLTQELPPGILIDDADIKAVVSGDTIEIRRHHQQSTFESLFATLVISTNHMPRNRDTSNGIIRRCVVVGFDEVFEGERRDDMLTDKLTRRAVLGRVMVKALKAYWGVGHEWVIPEKCKILLEEWKIENDPFLEWVRDQVELTEDDRDKIVAKYVYNDYVQWYLKQGFPHRYMLRKGGRFNKRVEALKGVSKRNGTRNQMTFYGLVLRENEEDLD